MKRIIYSCFLLTFLLLTQNISAQAFQGTVTPAAFCYNNGVNNGAAGVTVPSPGGPGQVITYSWTINNPGTGGSTFTVIPAAAPGTSSIIAITYTGCGNFVLTCSAFNSAIPGIPQSQFQLNVNVACLNSATITTSAGNSPTICPGAVISLSVTGAAPTWTWSPGNATGPTLNVNPTSSTCYTATGVTAAGCTLEASTCVTVQPIAVNITPQTQTVCAGTTVSLTANTIPTTGTNIQWYNITPPGPPVPLGTNPTQTAIPIALASTYSVNVGYNTCSVSATASVNLDTFLSLFVSSASPSVCPTETTVLTATSSATSYTWVAPAPTNTMAGSSYTQVVAGPGTYTVYGRNGTCYSQPVTVTIGTSSFVPTISSNPSPSVCSGQIFTVTGVGGATTATSYTWASFVPPFTFSLYPPGPSTITPSQTVTTVYGFSVTSPLGCIGSASLQVLMSPPVTITATASSPAVCAGSQVTITAGTAPSYTFNGGSGGPVTNTTGILIDNPTSNTVYTVTASNAAGYCTSAQVTVGVNMTIGGNISLTASSSAGTVCPGNPANLSVTGAATNFTWNPGSLPGPNVTVNPSVTTTYTVFGDNGGGCAGNATISVVVSPIPTVGVMATASAVCTGFTSTLTGTGAGSYEWTGSSFIGPNFQPSISVGPGTYTLYGYPAGANCPSLPAYFTVGTAAPLNIVASQSHFTTCIVSNSPKLSKPVVLNASGATTYAWFPYNPAYVTYPIGPTTTVRPPASTCYTVTGSTSICTGSAVICVTVIPQFTMMVVPPQPAICLGDSVKLSIVNIHTLAVGPASAFTYSWTEAANAPPPSLTNILTQTVIAWPQNTTTYTVEMSDSRGCASLPRLVTVTVLAQPITAISIPTINNVPTNTVCFVGDIPGAPDNSIFLLAYNNNPGGVPFGITPTYTWLSPYNPSSIVTPTSQGGVTVIAPARLPALAVYTVMSGYNGISGCKRVDTVTVRVIDCRPITSNNVLFTTDIGNDTLCSRNCVTYMALTDTMAGGPQTFTWTFLGGNPATSNEQNPTVCYDLPSKTGWNVILKVSNPYPLYEVPAGSTGVKYLLDYMKVVDVPNVTIVPPGQLSSDTTIKFGTSIVLTATNAVKYVWSPNYHISSLTKTIVTVSPQQTTQYIVTGYNSGKCFSSDTINVIVIEDCGEMYVPNAFSPNGDGTNDELKVRGICLETLTFMIFNRWGEKVFETTDISHGWDGTYHGEKMNTGVFVYRLEGKTYAGKGFSAKGNITLIR